MGTVTGMTVHSLGHRESHVALYLVINRERLQLLHRTSMNCDGGHKDNGGGGTVLLLVHFQGRLLLGVRRTSWLYEMGKGQLLKKCELRGLPTVVKTLQAAGDRVNVSNMMSDV